MRRVLLFGLALLAAPAFAQTATPGLYTPKPSNTTGFFLQAQLGGSAFGDKAFDGDAASGVGIGLGLGYGVSRVVTLFANYDFTGLSTDGTDELGVDIYGATFDIGVRLNFYGEQSQLVPYADLALSGVAVLFDGLEINGTSVYDGDDGYGGSGLTVGGGVQYYLSETFALRAGLLLSGGGYTYSIIDGEQRDSDDADGFVNARLHLGLSFYPSR